VEKGREIEQLANRIIYEKKYKEKKYYGILRNHWDSSFRRAEKIAIISADSYWQTRRQLTLQWKKERAKTEKFTISDGTSSYLAWLNDEPFTLIFLTGRLTFPRVKACARNKEMQRRLLLTSVYPLLLMLLTGSLFSMPPRPPGTFSCSPC